MAIKSPDSPYTGVPTVEATGGGGTPQQERATPEAFGAGVGQAVEKAGDEGVQVVQHFARMATEAKVNDNYANKYTPAAAALRDQYDQLRGQDKVAGYQGYIDGITALNKQFVGDTQSPYEKQLMGGLVDRHITGEIDGAKRELVASQKQFSDQSTFDRIKANDGYAAANYNNPAIVKSTIDQNNSLIATQHIDAGHDPNSEHGDLAISEAQRTARGDLAVALTNKAISSNDLPVANQLRAEHSDAIPAYQQQQLDSTLHVANMRQTGNSAVSALKTGQAIPHAVGAPPTQAQALVADNAQTAGIDANHALTVLRIESSNGKNLGTNPERQSLGQDKESSGKPLSEQAAELCKNLKVADGQAETALGRKPDGWEGYAVYQQGAGGGVALLKADPNAKAVDVIAPFYKTPAIALKAITANGGSASMTAEDFLGTVRDTYNQNAIRAKCDFAGKNPGDAITAPHDNASGIVVQPAATPTQQLMEYDRKAQMKGGYLDQIQAIPNYEVRQGVMEAYNRDRKIYTDKANAYTANLVNQSGQIMADPKFTSMDQVPPEMMAALTADHPDAIRELNARADYNTKKQNGLAAKNDVTNSPNGFGTVMRGLEPNDDAFPNRIESEDHVNRLWGVAADKGGINEKDRHDTLKTIELPDNVKGKIRPIMTQIANANGNIDGKGQDRALAWFNQTIDAYKANEALGDKKDKNFVNNIGKEESGTPTESWIHARIRQIENMVGMGEKKAEIPVITSPVDPAFAQLPAGSQFKTSDGQIRTKH